LYLALAESRQFFTLMTPYVLSKCKQELYTVCPSDVVLKTAREQNRIIALFLDKMDFVINTLRTGPFKLFKRPFPGFLTILTL